MKNFDMDEEYVAPVPEHVATDRYHEDHTPALLEQLKEPGIDEEDNPFSSLDSMSRIFTILQQLPADPPSL
jgi:hypothetical protein